MKVGVVYYPEHWDRSMWEQDAQLMKESGVRVIRVAEFAWSRLEPKEGIYQFDWLDEAVDLFHRYGLEVVIGTPTMTPPVWLTSNYPDVLPIDAHGHSQEAGVRGHRCYNSPSMRRHTAAIVGQLAARYGNHPAVIGWQTDNEFMMNLCHCESCTSKFRDRLKKQFDGNLDLLNREWGTVVWSGEYSDWSQVRTPIGGSPHQNPSLLLAFRRFQNDSIIEFQQLQVDILRRLCPDHFITHNTWSAPIPLDNPRLYAPLDFASFDYYPNTSPDKIATNPYSGALLLDRVRGFKRRNYWIMEQLSGPPGAWMPMWRAPYPGFIRAFSWQSFARGADAVVHFRWRSGTVGAEQFWHGLIDHSNVPGRRFAEFVRLTEEVNRMAPLLEGTSLRSKAAILYSHEHHSAFQLQPQSEGFDYYENMKPIHRSFVKQGIGVDVIDWRESLDAYKLVVAPALYLLDEATAESLKRYAAGGGTLVLSARTGVKNENNICWMQPLPGPLADAAGVVVKEYDPVGNDAQSLVAADGTEYQCSQWCDLLEPSTAEVLAIYGDNGTGFYGGTPAVTSNRYGEGTVIYVGTVPEEVYWSDLLLGLSYQCDLDRWPDLPEGIQVTARESEDGRKVWFVLNLSREPKQLQLPMTMLSLIDDQKVMGVVELEPYGVALLQSVEA
ncbi:beta-galactosidase [Paenibacillus sp. CCS19]|uniref:beta-galactosidase n=1 Tax=Paenibacillus sp. CCS19 TaxID=3158387 RepID=UPI00256303ED|nr:beta-galactosidase [Paenibacillus cellulosilyticus]GMK41132.1 beta-galactosidase [Paenibacillus cellulosilyticus]